MQCIVKGEIYFTFYYVVMVAIDEHTGRTKEVPGLIVETESQKAEWEGGIRRMALRKQRKLEGF